MYISSDYPEIGFDDQINWVVFVKNQRGKKIYLTIPFVVTCHYKLKQLEKLIKVSTPVFYTMKGKIQKIFAPPAVVSYRSTRKSK